MSTDRLLIVHIEDDPLWRVLVEQHLTDQPGMARVVQCENGAEGRALTQVYQPDLVLLDLRLPDAEGFALSTELARIQPRARILLLSARTDDVALASVVQEHIAGLVEKSPDIARYLPEAVATVMAGRKYYTPAVREHIRRLRADPSAYYKILSAREIELLPGFGLGMTDEELATRSGLRPLTVKSHRQHVMMKLNLHRTPELIHWAIEHGFVAPPPRIGWVREDA